MENGMPFHRPYYTETYPWVFCKQFYMPTKHLLVHVRPDMRYCFRSERFRPNPRTKHISVPPRHMTKSYIPDFNMISQHYRYKDTTSRTSGLQMPEYNTTAEDTCLSTDYKQVPKGKGKTHQTH